MKAVRSVGGALCLGVLLCLAGFSQAADWVLQSCTTENSGGWISNTVVSSASVGGQNQPVGIATNSSFMSYGGYVYTYVLQPSSDRDADTIPDEVDMDDDNDGLDDVAELSGSQFDPQTPTDSFAADSDGDGVSDHDEAKAGTNPQDTNSQFEVMDASLVTNGVHISWKSREGRAYSLISKDNLAAETLPKVLDTVTAVNGSGSWEETESEAILSLPAGDSEIFYIGKPGE